MSALSTPDYLNCFQLSPAAQAVLDRMGDVLDVNERACKALGYEREALLGRRLVELVHPDDRDAVVRAIQQSALDGEPFEVECRMASPEGGERWFDVQSAPCFQQGKAVAWYTVFADFTEHKLYQEARMAVETAERASQAKSAFLSRMSHELRTPLNAVIGFAQLLRIDTQPRLSESQLRKAELIERSGAHLLAVISDVLDLSRIEAGDMPISIEPVHVDTTVQDVLAMVAEAAQAAKVQLVPPLLELKVPAMADRVRLRQILMNLISNAIKYNRADGQVRVRAWQDDAQVSIQVSDTGLGLSPTQQAHLFEPFNRLGAEHTGVEGTGIGLVIVQRLVQLMNGSLTVTSQLGVGTTFTVALPAADTDQPSDHGPLIDLPQPTRAATVLYVEDNEVNVILVRQIMALRPAWKLAVANSGEQALKMVRQDRPDLLLLDMHLGDMSGFELVDLLDADPATRGIPKVALSADAMPDRVHAAREKGFSAYITKPLNVAMLLQCLEDQLSKA